MCNYILTAFGYAYILIIYIINIYHDILTMIWMNLFKKKNEWIYLHMCTFYLILFYQMYFDLMVIIKCR